MLFLQENNDNIFVKMRQKKGHMVKFQIVGFYGPF